MSTKHRYPYVRSAMSRLLAMLVPLLLCVGCAAQDDDWQKLTKEDPYTENDPAAMQELGIVRYGPFPWADGFSTADVDKLLGPGRVIWLETEHFRIGINLATRRLPAGSKQRKAIYAECERLNDRGRKVPKRPKRLGPWLQAHLYAQRCEQAYREFEQLVSVTDETFDADSKVVGRGPYLGLPDKFLLLLFEKKSDMARYMSRYCNMNVDDSMRYFHQQSSQMLLAVSGEGLDGFDAQGMHGHVLYALWQNLVNGYRGYSFPLPLWFSTGIAHYYSRQVETEFVNARIKDHESVDRESQNEWVDKVFKRARHDGATFTFEQLNAMSDWETFGFQAHMQCWSRVDFLMDRDPERVGLILDKLKRVPATGAWDAQGAQLCAMMPKLLFDAFELTPEAFDEQWREWVQKVYPKRRD